MPICKLCCAEKPTVKSHIIPEAFFREMRKGDTLLLVSGTAGEFPKRAPIGVYDERMLCGDCEKRFGDIDSFGAETLLSGFNKLFSPLYEMRGLAAYQSSSIDGTRLLRFLLSVLWRASASTQPFFRRVQLGPFEEKAIAAALDESAPIPVDFDAVLARWTDSATVVGPWIMDPFPERYDGIRVYRFYFGELIAYIKVDQHPFRGAFSRCSLRTSLPVIAIGRRMNRAKDFLALQETSRLSESNKAAFRRFHRR